MDSTRWRMESERVSESGSLVSQVNYFQVVKILYFFMTAFTVSATRSDSVLTRLNDCLCRLQWNTKAEMCVRGCSDPYHHPSWEIQSQVDSSKSQLVIRSHFPALYANKHRKDKRTQTQEELHAELRRTINVRCCQRESLITLIKFLLIQQLTKLSVFFKAVWWQMQIVLFLMLTLQEGRKYAQSFSSFNNSQNWMIC